MGMLFQPATIVVVGALVAFALSACKSAFDRHFAEERRVDSQEQAGSANVAVISVGRWEDYYADLQPTFKMDEELALKRVLPNTHLLQQETKEALSLLLKLRGPDVTLSESESKEKTSSAIDPTQDVDKESKSSSSGFSTKDTSDVPDPDGEELGAPGSLPSRKDILQQELSSDALMQYAAAVALFQEIKLMNRYVKDAASRDGYEPYVVRLQINLMPAARNEPYDAYTTLSFFPRRDTGGTAGPAIVVPGGSGKSILGTTTRLGLIQEINAANLDSFPASWQELRERWVEQLEAISDSEFVASYANIKTVSKWLVQPVVDGEFALAVAADWTKAATDLRTAAENLDKLPGIADAAWELYGLFLDAADDAEHRATVIAPKAEDTLWSNRAKAGWTSLGNDGEAWDDVKGFVAPGGTPKKRLEDRNPYFTKPALAHNLVRKCELLQKQLRSCTPIQLRKLQDSGGKTATDLEEWRIEAANQIDSVVQLLQAPSSSAPAPIVVPLLVADGLERSLGSRTTLVMQQYSLALSAMLKYFSASAGMDHQLADMLATVGNDYNSVYSIGRISENSVRVRIGAMLQSSVHYGMVPQSRYATLLLLVPKRTAPGEVVNMLTRTDFVDVKTGERLPWGDGADSPRLTWTPKFTRWFTQEYKDALVAEAVSNDLSAFTDTYFEAIKELRKRKAGRGGQIVDDRLSEIDAGYEVSPMAYVEQLWTEIVTNLRSSRYATTQLQLPKRPPRPQLPTKGEELTLLDDGTNAGVRLLRTPLKVATKDVYAELVMEWKEATTPPTSADPTTKTVSVRLPVSSVASQLGGRLWLIQFASLSKVKLGDANLLKLATGSTVTVREEKDEKGTVTRTTTAAGAVIEMRVFVPGLEHELVVQEYKINVVDSPAKPKEDSKPAPAVSARSSALLLKEGGSDAAVWLDFAEGVTTAKISFEITDLRGQPAPGTIEGSDFVFPRSVNFDATKGKSMKLNFVGLQPETVIRITVASTGKDKAKTTTDMVELPVYQVPPTPKEEE